MSASANLMRDIITKLSQPPSNPKSDFGKLVKYVDDNPMVKAAIRNKLTSDEEVLNMIRYAGPSLDENGTPRSADDPQVVKDFEAYQTFKSMAQEYLDNQEKKKISRKINYQEFKKKVWNNWNKLSKWETSLSNKMINTIKKIIPTEIDDAILKFGNKANDLTDAAVDKVTEFVTKRINRKIDELKAKEKEIGGKQGKTMKKQKNSKLNHNHNEWYLRFKGDNLAPLNYYDAIDEYVEFNKDSTKSLTPLVMRIPIQLVIPNDTKYLARLNQAFTANLTSLLNARGYGYTEYDSKDIGNYILNTRYAIALLAIAIRQLKVYSNYNTLNIMEPDLLIAAHNTSHYTRANIQIERNILTSLKERVRLGIEMLKTITAGAMPLYDRTLFLLSNYFKDSKSHKSCYFMFDLDADDEDGVFTYIYTIGNASSLSTETVTLPDIENVTSILNTFDKLVDRCFVGDYKAKQIRADINYLYGVTGSTYYTKYFEEAYKSINQPLKILDDEKILLQIHNMRFNPRLVMTHSKTGNHATYAIFTGASHLTTYVLPDINPSASAEVTGDRSRSMEVKYTKVNAWRKLSADDLVSVTRFVNLPTSKLEFHVKDDPNESTVVAIAAKYAGTLYDGKFENPIGMQVITYNSLFNGTNNQFSTRYFIVAGNIITPAFYDQSNLNWLNYAADFAKWSWSYADWMPHVKISVAVDCALTDEDLFLIQGVSFNDNYRIMHDLDMCADISSEQLDPIDQVAMLSELIWAQNGSSIIDTTKAKAAKSTKSSKDYRSNK